MRQWEKTGFLLSDIASHSSIYRRCYKALEFTAEQLQLLISNSELGFKKLAKSV